MNELLAQTSGTREDPVISFVAEQNKPSNRSLVRTPDAILHRSLSINTLPGPREVPVGFSRTEAATASDFPVQFRPIGAGTCGTVFERPGLVDVIKRARKGWEDALWNDYICHRRVVDSFTKRSNLLGALVHVPQCFGYIREDCADFWNLNVDLFLADYQAPAALLISERIFPLSKPIREAIISRYFPNAVQEEAKKSEGNKDCLVRLYLGKRRDPNRKMPPRTSLRNYNLHLDQMEALCLPTTTFATMMGRALAVMHWDACIDADNVEFVLGSAPAVLREVPFSAEQLEKLETPITTIQPGFDFHRRSVKMWVLDFNRCKKIFVKADENISTVNGKEMLAEKRTGGLQSAVDAFFRNDPYFPRPLSANTHEQTIWKAFADAYLETGAAILGGEGRELEELPQRFIQMVEKAQMERLARIVEAEGRLAAMGNYWE